MRSRSRRPGRSAEALKLILAVLLGTSSRAALADYTGKLPPNTVLGNGTSSSAQPGPTTGNGINLLDYKPVCNGVTDDNSKIVAAITAARSLGVQLIWPNLSCFSSLQVVFGTVPVHGASRVVASNPPIGPHLICPAALAAPCAVFGTTAANGLVGGAFDNLQISYSGSPVAGDAAFEVLGHNSTCSNVIASKAYDGFQFGNGTFGDAITTHCDHVYTWKIVHDHIVQNSAPEVFIENYRFGINGAGDVASNAFVGITGFDPNTLSLSHGVMALGAGVPVHVIDFFSLTNQDDGIYNITDTTIDVSAGSNSIVHSDGTGTCFRCTFSAMNVIALTSSMFDFAGGAPPMNESTFSDSNFFVNDFTFPTATYTALRVSNAYVSGTFSLTSASSGSGASLSNIQTGGAFTIGGVWGRLNMSGITAPSYIDTATGLVYASAVPTVPWTPTISFGGGSTGLTYLAQVGSATRNPDGTFTAQYGVKINAVGSSTGAVLVSGMPYTCKTYGLGANVVSPVYMSGSVGLTGTAIAVPSPATSQFGLSQSSSTGLPSLTNSNFATNSIVSGAITCPAQ